MVLVFTRGQEVIWGHRWSLADLPLQRLSRTHQGWQMAIDGFWSLPPGDVSAGCQTDTPDTWTASAGGAALVPVPRYHGNPLCNETLVHLVTRFIRKGEMGDKGKLNMQSPQPHVQPHGEKHCEEHSVMSLMVMLLLYIKLSNHVPFRAQCCFKYTHQLHALLGCRKSLWHTAWGHCSSFLYYRSGWCWGTFH